MNKLLKVLVASLLPHWAFAGEPVAIVQIIDSIKENKVDFLDMVEVGEVIELGEDGTLTLGYFKSCLEETVVGGTVTIGEMQSRVEGGKVRQEKTRCDGEQLLLAANESVESGAHAVRKLSSAQRPPLSKPTSNIEIYHVSPIFLVPNVIEVSLQRTDKKEKTYTLSLDAAQNKKLLLIDLQKQNIQLTPGGQYRLTRSKNDNVSIDFTVSENATSNRVPDIARMIPM